MESTKSGTVIGEQVLREIKSGKAKMRPKWHFALRAVLDITAIVIVFAVLVYLASFVIFALHQTGVWFATDFGFAGWYVLFNSLPWILVVLSLVFIVALAALVRRYPFGYQWPLVYALLAILFLMVSGTLLVTHTSLSQTLFASGSYEEFPFLGHTYGGFGVPMAHDVHRGRIARLVPNGFVIEESVRGGASSTVFVGPGTQFPYGSIFTIGDVVVVFGERSLDGTIAARGIEKIGP